MVAPRKTPGPNADGAPCSGCGVTEAKTWYSAVGTNGCRVWLHAGKNQTTRCRANNTGGFAGDFLRDNPVSSFDRWDGKPFDAVVQLSTPSKALGDFAKTIRDGALSGLRRSVRAAARIGGLTFMDIEAGASDVSEDEEEVDARSNISRLFDDDDDPSDADDFNGGNNILAQIFAEEQLGAIDCELDNFTAFLDLPPKKTSRNRRKLHRQNPRKVGSSTIAWERSHLRKTETYKRAITKGP